MSSTPIEPRDAPDASVDDVLTDGPQRPNPISDSPVGLMLQDAIDATYADGEDAEERYQEALERLGEKRGEVLVEIARALGTCSEDDYPLRWSLIHVAAELRTESALPLLVSVVKTPIPAERSDDPHSYSTVAEETLLRTSAVEGVAYLAREGDDKAIGTLFDFLDIDSLSVRRAAVQGLLAAPQADDLRDRIAMCLPKTEHFLLDLRTVDVREVEQIGDPESTLSESGRSADTAAPPRFDVGTPDAKRQESPKAERSESSKKPKKS